jgi:WD40 repeat protein
VAARLPGVDSGSAWPAFHPVSSLLAYQGPLISETNRSGLLLWDPTTGRQVAELPTGPLIGFGFSGDGKTIVTCDVDLTVVGWELHPERLVSSNSFKGVISAHQFLLTGDGSAGVLGDYLGNRCAVDLRTGKELWRHREAESENGSLALSKDDRILAVGPGMRGGPIVLYDRANGRELGRLEGHRSLVRSMVFWPDGRRLASASLDQTIRVWDLRPGAVTPPPRVLRGHTQEVWGLDLLPDGRTLVSASKDGEVCLWEVESGAPESQSGHLSVPGLSSWSFSSDNRSLLGLDLEAHELVQWACTGTNQTRTRLAFDQGAKTACWSEDGSRLAVGHTNGVIQVWELPGRTLRARFQTGTNGAVPIQFSRDATQLALFLPACDNGAQIELRESTTGKSLMSRPVPPDLILTIIVDGWSSGLQLSPDLRQLFARTRSEGNLEAQRALLWSIGDDRRFDLGLFDELGIAGVTFSPEGRFVAASGYSGRTKVWDTTTGRLAAQLASLMNAAAGITFSPDGKRFAVGAGGGGMCKIWDVETWRELITLPSEGQWLQRVRFSPDGNVLGASDRNFIQYWRAPSVEEVAKNL